jgi:hypothetical protein
VSAGSGGHRRLPILRLLNDGTKAFQYNSCSHVGSLQRLRNGWTDTWSSY